MNADYSNNTHIVNEYNAKVYTNKIREINKAAHELHSLINVAMTDLQDAFPVNAVTSPEWDTLHAMMQAVGIVSTLGYQQVCDKPSVFGEV